MEELSEDRSASRRQFVQSLAGATGLGAIGGRRALAQEARGTKAAEQRPPNFVVIFADDLGYGDVGCFGSKTIKTPNIDRLAGEGALLTGCYPQRVGVTKVLFPAENVGLNPDEVTIAETLKQRGYASACVGKWHLGHREGLWPTDQGFDEFYGFPYSNDMSLSPAPNVRSIGRA